MHVSGSGPLGVLLMIAPLAAIPVFAIVGVPHFAPVVASGTDDDDFAELGEPASRAPARTASDTATAGSSNDLYAPAAEPLPPAPATKAPPNTEQRPLAATAAAGRARRSKPWLPPSDALDQWEVRTDAADVPSSSVDDESVDPRPAAPADGFDGLTSAVDVPDDGQVAADGFNPDLLKASRPGSAKNFRTPAAAEDPLVLPADRRSGVRTSATASLASGSETGRGPATAADFAQSAGAVAQSLSEQSGWQDAARRLKKLGIRKYRLESRIDEQNFVFTCTLASADNPQVVRRFEADADNPLEAVEQVLEQIDEWRSRNGNDGELKIIE